MTVFINGVACETETWSPYVSAPDSGSEPFNKPFFVALTSALGIDLPGDAANAVTAATQVPATTRIKSVRGLAVLKEIGARTTEERRAERSPLS